MLGILVYVQLAIVVSLVYLWLCPLEINYDGARATGVPMAVMPFESANPLWMLLDRPVTAFFSRFPALKSSSFVRFNWRGWDTWDRYRAFQQHGNAIFFVTAGRDYLQICDARTVPGVFSRYKDFDQPLDSVVMLEISGPNLWTIKGAQWQEHRKITASTFNKACLQAGMRREHQIRNWHDRAFGLQAVR